MSNLLTPSSDGRKELKLIDLNAPASNEETTTSEGEGISASELAPESLEQIDLAIAGMTCSSCVARVEKAINQIPGASATVNFATETAHVLLPKNIKAKEVIDRVSKVGYEAKLRIDEEESFARSRSLGIRTILAGLLAIPAIALSMVMSFHEPVDELIHSLLTQFGLAHPTYSAHGWLVIALTAPIVLLIAWPIHRAGLKNALHPTMDTLVSLGSLTAFAWSIYANSTGAGDIYAEVAAGVLFFIILGRYFESKAKHRAGSALLSLLQFSSKEVTILRNNNEVLLPIAELQVGDHFILRPGDRIPADCLVISGKSSIDNSLLTGESLPIDVSAGSELTSGAVNLTSRLVVEAKRVGRDSELSRITQMVLTAQSEKAPVQQLVDRISAIFVPIVVLASILTFIAWYGFELGTLQDAVTASVSLLVIACPCALGLATPVALLVASGGGARRGIILRKTRVLEKASAIDTVIFDKTGTLTTGKMSTVNFSCVENKVARVKVLEVAYSLARESHHPVAAAIAQYSLTNIAALGATEVKALTANNLSEKAGAGLAAEIEISGEMVPVLLGSASSTLKATLSFPPLIESAIATSKDKGNSISILAIDGEAIAAFEVGDSLRSDAGAVIARLHDKGIESWLLSGDSEASVTKIAAEVGISPERTISSASPAAKIEKVSALKREGKRVLMVGDGVNDAAALAEADLSMAMGTGTDTAIATADITLIRSELASVVSALELSKKTLTTIRGNLLWAFLYNSIGIPIAALGLLNPMIAGGAMALSSLFVVMNSLRLKGKISRL
jgi:P-type Cu+ transporter